MRSHLPVDHSQHVRRALIVVAVLVAYVGFYAQLALQSLSCSGTAGAVLAQRICDYGGTGGGMQGAFHFSWGSTWVVDTVIAGALLAWCVRSRRRRAIAVAVFVSYLVVVRVGFIVYLVHAPRDFTA